MTVMCLCGRFVPLHSRIASRYPLNEPYSEEDDNDDDGGGDDHHHTTWKTDWDSTLAWMGDVYASAGSRGLTDSGTCGPDAPSGVIHGALWKQTEGELMDYLYFNEGEFMVRKERERVGRE